MGDYCGMQAIEMIPSARRLIKSLRDMGYDFAQAVADVVDNAIEAKASLVAIDVEFDGDNSWVRIADNGIGMRPEQLREAMRYGSERDYSDTDLGKFGLGLKTASMSQCQCLSVASRWNPDRADISAYSWDLEHIERTNKWEVLPADKKTLPIREPLKDGTGIFTVKMDTRREPTLRAGLRSDEFGFSEHYHACTREP
jgi:Histidine kinase-, DNA gyrase B-, and HSP90-like ATPase